jgi:hypothetical protein
VFKRLVVPFVAFVGLIVPGSPTMAVLAAAPTHPEAWHLSDCARELVDARAIVATMQARNKKLSDQDGSKKCMATQLYFLELVKERAMIASCKSGPERERDLRRFDADVARINDAIAARCL